MLMTAAIILERHHTFGTTIHLALRLHTSALPFRRPTILSTKRNEAFCRYASGLSPREIQRIRVNPEHFIESAVPFSYFCANTTAAPLFFKPLYRKYKKLSTKSVCVQGCAAPAACVLGDLHKKNAWLLLHKKPCIPFSSQTAECIFVAKQMRSAFRCSHSPHLYDIKPSSIGIGLNFLDFLVILVEAQFLVLDAHLRASGN